MSVREGSLWLFDGHRRELHVRKRVQLLPHVQVRRRLQLLEQVGDASLIVGGALHDGMRLPQPSSLNQSLETTWSADDESN